MGKNKKPKLPHFHVLDKSTGQIDQIHDKNIIGHEKQKKASENEEQGEALVVLAGARIYLRPHIKSCTEADMYWTKRTSLCVVFFEEKNMRHYPPHLHA